MRSPDPSAIHQTEEQRRARLRGIGLMLLAILCFNCIDTSGKYLGRYMDTTQIVWGRYFFAFLCGYYLYNPISRPEVMRTARPWLQFGRSMLLVVSTGLNLFALRYLQLDQVLSIMFCAPFVVAALAVPLLGEHVGWRRWTAICVGFLGVLVVTRPGFGGIHWSAILVFICACFYGFYSISTRLLSRTDSSETTLFYSNLVGTIIMCAIVPFVWQWPEQPWHLVLLVFMGAVGMLGHYLLIMAHRLAPASVLAPFMYTQMFWVIISGFLVFGDLPNRWTLTGASIVIASGLYLIYRERKVKGPAAPVSGDPVP